MQKESAKLSKWGPRRPPPMISTPDYCAHTNFKKISLAALDLNLLTILCVVYLETFLQTWKMICALIYLSYC